jgi:hypothetical protein
VRAKAKKKLKREPRRAGKWEIRCQAYDAEQRRRTGSPVPGSLEEEFWNQPTLRRLQPLARLDSEESIEARGRNRLPEWSRRNPAMPACSILPSTAPFAWAGDGHPEPIHIEAARAAAAMRPNS